MKNLPDRFPIRYAIVIPVCDNYEEESYKQEILFNEYLLLLKNKPLDFSMLFPDFASLEFTILNKKAFQIAKLYPTEEWAEDVREKIKELIPNIQCSNYAVGTPFSVGLYSYKKSYEIPAFVRLNKEDSYYRRIYKKIQEGKMDDWELYKMLSEHNKPIKQELYYSEIWEELDKNNQLEGQIECQYRGRDGKMFENLPIKKFDAKIPVLICKSWEELFAEEIFVLYRMFNYCNNCGKALPIGYSGKYCPNESENIKCIRERARKRKRSQKSN